MSQKTGIPTSTVKVTLKTREKIREGAKRNGRTMQRHLEIIVNHDTSCDEWEMGVCRE